MSASLHKVACSFAKNFYSTLAEDPSSLGYMYTTSARSEHQGKKADGSSIQSQIDSLYKKGSITAVHVDKVDVTPTTYGVIEVIIEGALTTAPNNKRTFQHKVQLRETAKNTYAIVSDDFRYRNNAPAAPVVPTESWALESPELKPEEGEEIAEELEPLESAPAATEAAKEVEKDAEEKEEIDMSGLSFAERLRLTKVHGNVGGKTAETKQISAAPAVASTKDKTAKKDGDKKKDGEKKDAKSQNGTSDGNKKEKKDDKKDSSKENGAANGEKKRRERKRNAGLVFYDVVVKGLPQDATEATVRKLVGNKVDINLVKVESSPAKQDPKQIRTFAFVQLDVKKESMTRKEAIAAVIEDAQSRNTNKEIRFQEVHERRLEKKNESQ